MPETPDAGEAKAKEKLQTDIAAVKDAVEEAEVVVVGPDHDYRPDAPHLREQFEDDY